MNFLTSKRLVTTALVLLALLNITLLGFIWWQNTDRMVAGPGARNHQHRQFFFTRQLALNRSQTVSFDRLRQEYFLKIRPDMQAISMLKRELIEESLQEKADTGKITVIAENIGTRQAIIERELALHFHELAKVCTPEQRDSLKAVLERFTSRKRFNSSRQ
ncbi:MAG: periplasmic heavy metal sensor [Chlorobiaceae bacterium]|jgi:Spy/CpxP family protein refolding chaperone|nr:periplasmic heavy metal sensor [Chlorobiaceae bacterium]NTV16271.1 periplasmic heavy metal sensor [Chlorobiaceae bacterium]